MLPYSMLQLSCKFETQALLPIFKANIFRGALGNNLRKICCPFKRKDCSECILKTNCIYFFIFESQKNIISHPLPSPPHPFVLEPPNIKRTEFNKGDSFDFSIILIDKAIKWIPHIIYATIHMGETGIGFKRQQGLGRFKLIKVLQDEKTIYDLKENELTPKKASKYLDIEQLNIKDRNIDKLQIDFLTPYRVKYKNSLATNFNFSILIRAALRRISSLEKTFFGKEPELDYKGLIKRASLIETILEENQWLDMNRYSFRQKTKMKLGGLMGRAIYKGKLDEFYPILRYCEIIHIGKQSSFGFGKIKLTILK